ncbi:MULTISPECIES: hypothetical protein [Paenibacillus]|uniref:hypothetical protein n=1 Tax=Paenibacillus TaxID=44249 RepID=UPI001C303A7A|nr:hypothetical protein [Paenibacillus sp. GbtcB18]
MRSFILGCIQCCFGITLLGLGGLEKILIFMIVSNRAALDINSVIGLTPAYIWNITNYTLSTGAILVVMGIIFLLISRNKQGDTKL